MPAPTAALSYNAHLWEPDLVVPGTTNFDYGAVSQGFVHRLTLDLSGDHASGNPFEIDEAEVFVSFASFIDVGSFWYPRGTSPRAGFFGLVPSGLTPGDVIPLRPVNLGDLPDSLAVFGGVPGSPIAKIVYVDATTLRIELDTQANTDLGEYLRAQTVKHSELFRKPSRRSSLDDNTLVSVYNEEKALGIHVMVEKEKEKIRFERHFPLRLRWWNQDIDGQDITTGFEVKIKRNEGAGLIEFDTLSSFVDNKIEIRIEKPAAGLKLGASEVRVWEEHEGKNAKDWFLDTKYSQGTLLTTVLSTQIDGLIWSPSSNWNLVGGYYEGSFTIPANLVDSTKRYKIGVLSPVLTDPASVFQYVQPYLKTTTTTADGIQPPCDFAIEGTVQDYDGSWSTTLIENAAPGDRYRICAKIDKSVYESCAGIGSFWNDIGSFTMKVYPEGSPLEPIYTKTVFKDPLTENGFPVVKKFSYEEVGDDFTVCFDFRAMILNSQGLADFANDRIVFEWQFKFNYYGSPSWSTIYLYKFTFDFNQYDNLVTSPARKILSILYFDANTGLPIGQSCDRGRVLIEIKLDAGHGSDGSNIRVRGLLDRDTYGVTLISDQALKERDGYVSPEGFTQREDDPIEYIDEYFDVNGMARMIVDLDLIDDPQTRRVIAIQRPV